MRRWLLLLLLLIAPLAVAAAPLAPLVAVAPTDIPAPMADSAKKVVDGLLGALHKGDVAALAKAYPTTDQSLLKGFQGKSPATDPQWRWFQRSLPNRTVHEAFVKVDMGSDTLYLTLHNDDARNPANITLTIYNKTIGQQTEKSLPALP